MKCLALLIVFSIEFVFGIPKPVADPFLPTQPLSIPTIITIPKPIAVPRLIPYPYYIPIYILVDPEDGITNTGDVEGNGDEATDENGNPVATDSTDTQYPDGLLPVEEDSENQEVDEDKEENVSERIPYKLPLTTNL